MSIGPIETNRKFVLVPQKFLIGPIEIFYYKNLHVIMKLQYNKICRTILGVNLNNHVAFIVIPILYNLFLSNCNLYYPTPRPYTLTIMSIIPIYRVILDVLKKDGYYILNYTFMTEI